MVCSGKEACPVFNPGLAAGPEGAARVISTEGEETLEAKWMRWNGLYCPKHNAFYCAAEGECGSCDVGLVDYRQHMERSERGGR